MISIMKEFGIDCDLTLKSDAVAAIGMVRRQGLGRIRHRAVADLWVQQKAKENIVSYVKLPSTKNTSDILTKPVEAEILERHMRSLGLEFRSGRNALTPAFNGKEDGIAENGGDATEGLDFN